MTLDTCFIDQTIDGLEKGVALVRHRSNLHLPLPESAIEGDFLPIDVWMFELWTRRIITDLRELQNRRLEKKLTREANLARQTCTAVLVCRDLLLEDGKTADAEKLVSSYLEFSELEISTATRLKHKKLEKWLNFAYHHDWTSSKVR